MTKVSFKIDGMHCGSCAMNIDDGLEELEGVTKSKTSYRKQETEVSFDEARVGVETIIETVGSLGYEAVAR